MEAKVALTTVQTAEDAAKLARVLLERRLCACVNILPGVSSLYWWKGAIQSEPETLLIIKSRFDQLLELEKAIRENHPYEVGEFLVLDPERVGEPYLKWLLSETAAH